MRGSWWIGRAATEPCAERPRRHPEGINIVDALWWGVTTITLVGYGDVVPKTVEGRLVVMVLILLGIGLFSAITATITSYLLSLDRPASGSAGLARHLADLAALRAEGSLTEDEFVLAKAQVLRSVHQ